MGEVYRATDTKLGREVAIKTLAERLRQGTIPVDWNRFFSMVRLPRLRRVPDRRRIGALLSGHGDFGHLECRSTWRRRRSCAAACTAMLTMHEKMIRRARIL